MAFQKRCVECRQCMEGCNCQLSPNCSCDHCNHIHAPKSLATFSHAPAELLLHFQGLLFRRDVSSAVSAWKAVTASSPPTAPATTVTTYMHPKSLATFSHAPAELLLHFQGLLFRRDVSSAAIAWKAVTASSPPTAPATNATTYTPQVTGNLLTCPGRIVVAFLWMAFQKRCVECRHCMEGCNCQLSPNCSCDHCNHIHTPSHWQPSHMPRLSCCSIFKDCFSEEMCRVPSVHGRL